MLLFTLLAKCLFLTFLRSHFLFFDNLLIDKDLFLFNSLDAAAS